VLEIASGTGQHVTHFARALTGLVWQPSDPDPEMRASIEGWINSADVQNVCAPLDLDVRREPWPVQRADALLCINMIHIAPWAATEHLMAGAGSALRGHGVLVLYGPYRREGRHTAASNEAFDEQLRAANHEWGVRDLEVVTALAGKQGFALDRLVEMPANNLMVVFRREPTRSLSAGVGVARP